MRNEDDSDDDCFDREDNGDDQEDSQETISRKEQMVNGTGRYARPFSDSPESDPLEARF